MDILSTNTIYEIAYLLKFKHYGFGQLLTTKIFPSHQVDKLGQ